MDTEYCTKDSVDEHLSDKTVYRRLTKGGARSFLAGVARLLEAYVSRHQDRLTKAEYQYLNRGITRNKNKLAKFYVTVKVHKPAPHPYRLIVATCGTTLAILSKWLDYKL